MFHFAPTTFGVRAKWNTGGSQVHRGVDQPKMNPRTRVLLCPLSTLPMFYYAPVSLLFHFAPIDSHCPVPLCPHRTFFSKTHDVHDVHDMHD